MKMFVVGASGRTGRPVVKAAVGSGHDVTAFVRNRKHSDGDSGVVVVCGDPLNSAALADALRGHP